MEGLTVQDKTMGGAFQHISNMVNLIPDITKEGGAAIALLIEVENKEQAKKNEKAFLQWLISLPAAPTEREAIMKILEIRESR